MVFYVFVVSVLFGLYLLPLYVLWFFMYTCMYAYNYVHVHCFICVTFTGEGD